MQCTSAPPLNPPLGLEVKSSKCAVLYGRRSGNNWYKEKRDVTPRIVIDGKNLSVYRKNESYKYLGKSLALTGEDDSQIIEFVSKYKELVDQIKSSELPLVLKYNAFNNFALAKVLHHFYNTRLSGNILQEMESHLVKSVRNIFGFYQSTTKLFIFIPRLNGGLGIKRISNVYYTTRLSFLIKMLNHSVENFRFIARESLKMDMLKRGVKSTGSENNFLGYELNDDSYLCTSTYYGCQSDWPDMVRYARKLNIGVRFVNDEAVAIFDNYVLPNRDLQKRLYQICIKQDLSDASKLSIQGPFLNLTNINAKATHSILYNWKLSDHLLRFVTKARLSILPTKFTTLYGIERIIQCVHSVVVKQKVLLICSMVASERLEIFTAEDITELLVFCTIF